MQAALPVPALLAFTILVSRLGMALAIGLLIVRMRLAPLPLAVADDFGVLGIGLDVGAMVVGTPLALAVRLAANGLIVPESRGLERLLTVTARAKRQIIFSGDCW